MTEEQLNQRLLDKYEQGFKSGRKAVMELMLKFLRDRMQEMFVADKIAEATHLRDVVKIFESFDFHK